MEHNDSHREPTNKKKGKKLLIVLSAVVLVGIIIAIILPRSLTIGIDDCIEMNVGDTVKLDASGAGLSESDIDDIQWTIEKDTLLVINNGVLCATYDKDHFKAEVGEYYENSESYSYTSYIDGKITKGLTSWRGRAEVTVYLEPEEFKSGELIKEPEDPRNSYIVITGAEESDIYVYFKSQTKSANDVSFVIEKGDTVTVYMPCDKYKMYKAYGDTWYGPKILFGPKTLYDKANELIEFNASSYWTLKFEVEDGNMTSEDIEAGDFPE